MDLQEFVSESLQQIINGVAEAQDEAKSIGAKVNPSNSRGFTKFKDIHFDIAVTVNSEKSGTTGGKLQVAGIGFGKEGAQVNSHQTVSRVSFDVSILFPFFRD